MYRKNLIILQYIIKKKYKQKLNFKKNQLKKLFMLQILQRLEFNQIFLSKKNIQES